MCDQQSLRSDCAYVYAQSGQSLCWSLEYSMSVNLLTEHHLEFLSLKGSCTGSSESTLVRMPHCWKSHVAAQLCFGCSKERSHGNLWIRRYKHFYAQLFFFIKIYGFNQIFSCLQKLLAGKRLRNNLFRYTGRL